MKRVLTILPLTALCISTMQAQHKNEYTNFADTTFNIQEVVATAARKPRPQITKLDVPMKYLPISINSITASSLELRGIRNIQDAVRFMPGVRFQTSYGAFQQLSIRGFDHSIMMIDGIRDERSAINNSYPVPDLSCIESIELLKFFFFNMAVTFSFQSIACLLFRQRNRALMLDWPTVVTRIKRRHLAWAVNWSVRSIITPMSTFPIKRAGVIMATVAFPVIWHCKLK